MIGHDFDLETAVIILFAIAFIMTILPAFCSRCPYKSPAGWACLLVARAITHFSHQGVKYFRALLLRSEQAIAAIDAEPDIYSYFFLPDELKGPAATAPPGGLPSYRMGSQRSKYEIYDLEAPPRNAAGAGVLADTAADFELSETSSDDEEMDITYRQTPPAPLLKNGLLKGKEGARKGHRHTASIASLIRGEERTEAWELAGTGGQEKSGPSTRKWAALGRGRSGRYDASGLGRERGQAKRSRGREGTGRG